MHADAARAFLEESYRWGGIESVEAERRASDGTVKFLFRLKDGNAAEADPNVALVSGALESSNVNVVDEMVNMISLARQFDMQMKLLQHAETNDSKATELLSLGG